MTEVRFSRSFGPNPINFKKREAEPILNAVRHRMQSNPLDRFQARKAGVTINQ
jgi:hypothetical protein